MRRIHRLSACARALRVAVPLVALAVLAASPAQAQQSRACMIEADKRVMASYSYTAECYQAAKGVRPGMVDVCTASRSASGPAEVGT